MLTVSMNVQYLGALVEEDAIGEGWVEQRGRSIVFCRAEVTGASSGRVCANATLVYKVSPSVQEQGA
jgi:acyl-coenzyme A thioesterase PaaI-like protein